MVIVYGTVCADYIRKIERLPAVGGYAEILDEEDHLGGEAANTALALAKWGCPNLLVGAVGDDEVGAWILAELSQRSVEPGLLQTNLDLTPYCDIYVSADGERTIFGHAFARLEMLIEPSFDPIPSAWFTADPNHGSPARAAVRAALAGGMRVYLEDFFQPDDPIVAGSFWQSSTDWLGTRGNTQKNVAWVQAWVAQHGCFAVLSDGPNGFVAGSPAHPVRHFSPFPCPLMVDSTGAGDAFRAGMLFGLDAGWPTADCLRFGSAAGSLNCRGFGGNAALPSRVEIEALIAAHPEISRRYE